MITYKNFGEYITGLRKSRQETSRATAEQLGISPGYYNDIEKSRRVPPDNGLIDKIVFLYHLSEKEQSHINELAGQARQGVSPDLPDYIMQNEVVRVALRLAKDTASSDDWHQFIKNLEKKKVEKDASV